MFPQQRNIKCESLAVKPSTISSLLLFSHDTNIQLPEPAQWSRARNCAVGELISVLGVLTNKGLNTREFLLKV